MQPDRRALVARHARDRGPAADLRWLRPAEAADAEAARALRLDALRGQVTWGFTATKLDVQGLSPGCQACGEGVWSCLFVNGSCGAGCFFCPTTQDEEGVPQTHTLTFPEPADYLDYLDLLGFGDVSLSGGEPLATPARTLTWLRALRAHRPDAHLWLYSSGRLVDEDKLRALAPQPLRGEGRAAFADQMLAPAGTPRETPPGGAEAWTGWLGHELVRWGLQVYAEAAAEPAWFAPDASPTA